MSEHDLVLFGATGFTGALVAEYLTRKAPKVRWAIAGRNRGKLDALKARLVALDPSASEVAVLVGDSLNPESLDPIVQSARVVCTTVGPYAEYGTPLVEKCVEHGKSYCDLTGEPNWIRQNVDSLHTKAAETGARIVHCCGFDSIPSDIGVWMLQDHLQREHGDHLAKVTTMVGPIKGGLSGGTFASMAGVLDAAEDRDVRRALVDPYGLNPPEAREGPDGRDQMAPKFDDALQRWTAPFMMAGVNSRIVRRSNALLDFAYGKDFRYHETMDMGSGLKGRMRAYGMGAGLGALMAGLTLPVAKQVVRGALLPKPGEGPDEAARKNGFFRYRMHAESSGTPSKKLVGLIEGYGDPGYQETARMLSEAALCLAQDDLPDRAGVLTPASAMGGALLERLRAAGMKFAVQEAE